MLRIERMELCGFKSFSDRTEIHFPRGITAVVGPNGCGKSNIGDAINWVLGEQSAKLLRGQQMADVIFNGSEGRKPLGMAEVSLGFSGAEGLAQSEGGRILITRRLFRSGESEYLLNGHRARLKDIQELLRLGNVGARTYATIEQGKIDQVLNAKPRDRRALIEDAAGISGYKHKRRLAELKLEATQANLLRVNDIVREVQRQIGSLKRQAAKARRYRILRDELRQREGVRFARRALDSDAELAERRDAESAARDREAAAAAALAHLEAELGRGRQAVESAQQQLRQHAERLHALDLAIDRGQAQVVACTERIQEAEQSAARFRVEGAALETREADAAGQLAALRQTLSEGHAGLETLESRFSTAQAEVEDAEAGLRALREAIEGLRQRQFESMARSAELRNRARSIDESLDRLGLQQKRLQAERDQVHQDCERFGSQHGDLASQSGAQQRRVAELREQQQRVETELQDCRQRLTTELAVLSEAREQLRAAQTRRRTLEDIETRFAGLADGVKALFAAGESTGIQLRGVVADYVETSRETETAAEGYLQWLLPTVIVETDGDAQRAARWLRAEGAGRTLLLSRTQPVGALAVGSVENGHGPAMAELLADARVTGRLRERLSIRSAANGVLADRIGDAVLVDSLDTALELHRSHPSLDFLTAEGDVVYASGIIAAGGAHTGDRGMLAHQRQLRESDVEIAEAAQRLAVVQALVDTDQSRQAQLEVELRGGREALDIAERRDVELQLHAERSAIDRERSAQRSLILSEELEAIAADEVRLRAELEATRHEGEAAERTHHGVEVALRERTEATSLREVALRALTEAAAALRAELAAQRQRQAALEGESRRLGDEAAQRQQRLAALSVELAAAHERGRAALELQRTTEGDLGDQIAERAQLAERIAADERALSELQATWASAEGATRELRLDLETAREATRCCEIDRTRAESDRQHLDDLCRQELGISAGEAVEAAGDAVHEIDLPGLESTLAELRERIEKLGPVNMTAIDEFSELEQRHTFLTTQKADLEQSIEALKETIRRINRQSRERFTEAFDAIRLSFQEVYRLLFNGGRADLRLEESDDALEAGIEILAQPPGKRLTSVSLLSGGEKALSAIALLFAIFRYQPSPFCLLDEVDAPLDDSNVARFARMVREYAENTQFILVTHNKLSMESANLLYGVTMAEPGVSRLVSLQLES